MRTFLLKASIVTVLVAIVLATGGISLATASPFKPGDVIFALQDFAEQQRARLISDPQQQAAFQLDLAERRLRDLIDLSGSKHEKAALTAIENALERTTSALTRLEGKAAADYRSLLHNFALRVQATLPLLKLVPEQDQALFTAFQARLEALILLLADADSPSDAIAQLSANLALSEILATPAPDSLEVIVSFPPGSYGAEHSFYPLLGEHSSLACESCHATGQYQGTSTACESCHEQDTPEEHFSGDCAACHSPASWLEVDFDHSLAGSNDCKSCHASDAPTDHYSGQCSNCHLTSNWQAVDFDHTGFTGCKDCHTTDAPTNHYSGQCSSCHSTGSWANANFNHNGFTNCKSCHASDAPSNHYSGQCSSCHSTGGWGGATFDHSGQTDCKACHADDAPSNHYSGQCSSCHSTGGWAGATFDHSGQTDCKACHASDAPSNHYSGQCSSCHSTSGWGGATFNHSGQTDCKSCHASDAPDNHYSGQCSSCHTTTKWGDANFSHDGQTDCISCHLKDRPDEHDTGQCSTCHNTSKWDKSDGDQAGMGNTVNTLFPGVPCTNCHPAISIIADSAIGNGFTQASW